jgi:hypothetical protein
MEIHLFPTLPSSKIIAVGGKGRKTLHSLLSGPEMPVHMAKLDYERLYK